MNVYEAPPDGPQHDAGPESTINLRPMRILAVQILHEAEAERRKTVAADLGMSAINDTWGISGIDIVNTYRAMHSLRTVDLLRQTISLPGKEGKQLLPTLENITFSLLIELLREQYVWRNFNAERFDKFPHHDELMEASQKIICKEEYFGNSQKRQTGLFIKDNLNPLIDFLEESVESEPFEPWQLIAADVGLATITLCGDYKQDLSPDSGIYQRMVAIYTPIKNIQPTEYKSFMSLLPKISKLYPDELSIQLINRLIHRVHALGPVMLRLARDPQALLAFSVSSLMSNEDFFKLIQTGSMSILDAQTKQRIINTTNRALSDVGVESIPHIFLAMCQMSDDSKQASSIIEIWLNRLLTNNRLPTGQYLENFRDYWQRLNPQTAQIPTENEAEFVMKNITNKDVWKYLRENIMTKIIAQQMH